MIFFTAATLLPFFFSYHKSPITSSYFPPSYASHQELSPSSSDPPTPEPNEFNHPDDNRSSLDILSRKYYKIPPSKTPDESPPYLSNNQTDEELSTLRKYFHYYELLQILQSPYASQQQKIETIQRNTDVFPTSSPITRPNLWNGLDW